MEIKNTILFITVWFVNALLLIVANFLFPDSLELGNAQLTLLMAALISGLYLTLWTKLAKVFAVALKLTPKGRYMMFLFYWFANSAGIWIIARLASITGFGIVSYMWAIGLGFAASLSQWTVRQGLKKVK